MLVLDTHILIWFLAKHRRIADFHDAIKSAIVERQAMISALSVYEFDAAVKKGKVDDDDVAGTFEALELAGLIITPANFKVVKAAMDFAPIHKDPIDRIIAGTAKVNNAVLMTADRHLQQYPIKLAAVR